MADTDFIVKNGLQVNGILVVNSTIVKFGNSTSNVAITNTSIAVGANVNLSTSGALFGNSTVNATVNSTTLTIVSAAGNTTISPIEVRVNTGAPQVRLFDTTDGRGAWFHFNNEIIYLLADRDADGAYEAPFPLTLNTNTNLAQFWDGPTVNSTAFRVSGTTYYFDSSGSLLAGQVNVGANVTLSPSSFLIGNSTVNVTATATNWKAANTTYNSTLANWALTLVDPAANGYYRANGWGVGNSTVNVVCTTTGIDFGTAAVNSTAVSVGANAIMTSSSLTIGNSTVNSSLTNYVLTLANATWTTTYTRDNANIGDTMAINSLRILIGNSTVNLFCNSSTLTIGANVALTPTTLTIGNSTVNTVITSTNIGGSSNAQLNVVNSVTVNATTTVGVGANVTLSTSKISVGNSTVNSHANSTGFYLNGTAIGGGSAYTLISSTTVSSATTSLTGFSGYSHYVVVLVSYTCATPGAQLRLAVSSNGGSTYGTNATFSGNTSSMTCVGHIYGAAETSQKIIFTQSDGSSADTLTSAIQDSTSTGSINAIRIASTGSSGFSGTIHLLGIS